MAYTNLQYLNEFTDGDPELTREAIQRYLKNSPDLLNKLNSSYENEDWEQLAFIAHNLYSSTQILGIISIAEPLKDIQQLSKDQQDRDQIKIYIEDINKAVNASYKELDGYK